MLVAAVTVAALTLAAGATVHDQNQEYGDSLRLSLDECVRIALSDNPTVKVADMEVKRVDYSRKEVLGQLLPSLNFTGSYTRNLSLQTIYMDAGGGETRAIKMGRDNQFSTGFNATIPLVMPTLWKSLKVSDDQILQNLEAARANKLSLVHQVKNAYYAQLLAIDTRRVLNESYATAKFVADVYAKQFAMGAASEYDVLRANVAVTNLEPSLLEVDNSIRQLGLQLKMLMGMDVRTPLVLTQSLEDFKARMYDRTLSTDTALTRNTSLRTLELQTESLRHTLEMRKAAWWPTLSGSASLMWSSMSNGNPLRNFMWTKSSSVGLTLSLPIFQGGQRYYRQKQAEISLNEMKWRRENLERSLQLQVQSQMDNIVKSLKQVESNAAGVRQAVKANEIMHESFKIGAATFIQVLDTENALLDARLAYFQTIYNYLVAENELEFTLGNSHFVNE